MNIVYLVLVALAGLLVGGLINLLADDLPYTNQVRRAHYPDDFVRPPLAWLGLAAFLTGKRSSPEGAKLAWRHPLTEIVTAMLFVYIATIYSFTGHALFWMGNIAILVLITVIDLEHRLILFVVIIPACIYVLIGDVVFGTQISDKISFTDYLIGGLMGFLIFFVIYGGGILFSRIMARIRGEKLEEVAFGYGDVMLATLSGFMLGWQALIFAIFIAVFAGFVGSLIYLVARLVVKGKYELFTALPYGQYIVFGTIVMMLWRTPVINYLQGN